MRISGRQVVLRDWQTKDLDAYATWLAPGHDWQTLDGPYYGSPDPSKIEATLERCRASLSAEEWPTPRTELVVSDASSDALRGRVTRYWISEETNWLALGIDIYDPRHWGRGLGREALGLWCEYLWRELPQLIRLDLRTWSGNVGMMRLAEKLGFRQEACFRRARIVDGEYFDGLGYGILREEWRARYPGGFS